jgi:hypothetical protein
LTDPLSIVGMFKILDRARIAIAVVMTVLFLGAVFTADALTGFSSPGVTPATRPIPIASAAPSTHVATWDEASGD